MERTRVYRNGVLEAESFPVADISDHLAVPGTVVWLDLCAPDQDDLAAVSEEFGLHPLAVEDAIHEHQRPKLDRYQTHLFLSTYAVSLDIASGELQTSEVAVFVTKRALITVRKDDRFDIDGVVARWDDSSDLAKHGVGFLTVRAARLRCRRPFRRRPGVGWRAGGPGRPAVRPAATTAGRAAPLLRAAQVAGAAAPGRPAHAGGRQRPHAPRLWVAGPADGALLPGRLRPRPPRHRVDRVPAGPGHHHRRHQPDDPGQPAEQHHEEGDRLGGHHRRADRRHRLLRSEHPLSWLWPALGLLGFHRHPDRPVGRAVLHVQSPRLDLTRPATSEGSPRRGRGPA